MEEAASSIKELDHATNIPVAERPALTNQCWVLRVLTNQRPALARQISVTGYRIVQLSSSDSSLTLKPQKSGMSLIILGKKILFPPPPNSSLRWNINPIPVSESGYRHRIGLVNCCHMTSLWMVKSHDNHMSALQVTWGTDLSKLWNFQYH